MIPFPLATVNMDGKEQPPEKYPALPGTAPMPVGYSDTLTIVTRPPISPFDMSPPFIV